MTGKYPWSNVDAKILPGNAALIIDTQKITLPKLMKQAGYTTGSVGKWHIGLGDGQRLGVDVAAVKNPCVNRIPSLAIRSIPGV